MGWGSMLVQPALTRHMWGPGLGDYTMALLPCVCPPTVGGLCNLLLGSWER